MCAIVIDEIVLTHFSQLKVYHAVIEDVISNVRDAFLDEGVDEQVLQEMKQIWRNKLLASKAVELNPEPGEPGHHPPPIVANNPKVSKECYPCPVAIDWCAARLSIYFHRYMYI